MRKKVLVISGSPRKGGNSDQLCDQFVQGAQEQGHSVKKVSLRDLTIGFCTACYACRGKKSCIQKDDMTELLNNMVDADVIVLSTPMYYYGMNGQMKTMIDRTLPRYTEIRDKDLYYIVTAATTSRAQFDRTFEGFSGFLDCLNGAEEKGRIYASGVYQPGDVMKTDFMRQAYEMGKGV